LEVGGRWSKVPDKEMEGEGGREGEGEGEGEAGCLARTDRVREMEMEGLDRTGIWLHLVPAQARIGKQTLVEEIMMMVQVMTHLSRIRIIAHCVSSAQPDRVGIRLEYLHPGLLADD
jgi:hypothetical protein